MTESANQRVKESSHPDIAILGAGVIGCSCARALARRGVKVTLIDAQTHSREASWAAGGMLAPHSEFDRPNPLFDLGRTSLNLYPQLRHELLEHSGEDIDLRQEGMLLPLFSEEEVRAQKVRAFLEFAGVEHRLLSEAEVRREEPALGPRARGALWVPDHSVDSRRLLAALTADCERRGVTVAMGCRVDEVDIEGGRVTALRTHTGTVSAGEVVIAAGAWSGALAELFGFCLPVAPVKGQMLRFSVKQNHLHHVIRRGHCYLVPRTGRDLIVGATTEHVGFDKGLTNLGLSLQEEVAAMVPSLTRCPISERWAGLRPRLEDGLPAIGRVPGFANLCVATGHYRNGILLTPITGEAIASVILGEKPPCDLAPFDPGRFL